MNQTTIAGHLGADPEVRFTSTGQKVTTLRVAARVRRGAKDKDETIWWRVSLWGDQFDKMISYLKKGSPVIAVGEINKPEIFTDREGKPQISMSMTGCQLYFSPFGKPESSEGTHSSQPAQQAHETPAAMAETAFGQGKATQVFSDDEIPF